MGRLHTSALWAVHSHNLWTIRNVQMSPISASHSYERVGPLPAFRSVSSRQNHALQSRSLTGECNLMPTATWIRPLLFMWCVFDGNISFSTFKIQITSSLTELFMPLLSLQCLYYNHSQYYKLGRVCVCASLCMCWFVWWGSAEGPEHLKAAAQLLF